MEKSKKDSTIKFSTKPLILVPDSDIQRNPLLTAKMYPAPATISQEVFDLMAHGANQFGKDAGFEWIAKPAYQVYESPIFNDTLRKTFWKPILKMGYPIYIVNPYCGLLWPGDKIGLYHLNMESVFWFWRVNQLWKATLELLLKNGCNSVISFLPQVYDNVVHLSDGTPWVRVEPEEFPKYTDKILEISRKTCSDNHEQKIFKKMLNLRKNIFHKP